MQNKHLTTTKFSDFKLSPVIHDVLEDAGFEFCTPIQAQSLPLSLQGKDIAGQAQTGTGKTLSFLIAMFEKLLRSPSSSAKSPRALILAPTRELALQIYQDGKSIADKLQLKMAAIYGGEPYEKQQSKLESGVDIVIGTTGRIIDFYKQGFLPLQNIEVLVLDEADRMFDLGFIKDIRYLLRRMPEPSQRLNLLFSATLSMKVQELAYEHMNDPQLVEIAPQQKTNTAIKEEIFFPSSEHKIPLLLTLIEEEWPEKAIIFANTKHQCETLWGWLEADGHRVGLLTGDVPQKRRLQILEQFTSNKLDFLVATDVAARGLHIDQVTHVFNFDLPDDCEDYVHRIGRTGRAGATGHAISFACETYALNLLAIEQYITHAIPVSQYDAKALLDDLPKSPKKRPLKRQGQPQKHRVNRNLNRRNS
tara:strand:+ start:10635 stop:11894 length:1260 start_codon:yes stop_codon:yes gene_type:complete